MKAAKIVVSVLGLCVTAPIRWYLAYSLLRAVHADRLLMFLFWVYVPVAFLVLAIDMIVTKAADSKE